MDAVAASLMLEGYLTRRRDKDDRRCSILHITAEGRALMERVCPLNEERIVEMTDMLSGSEKEQLVALLKKLGGAHDGT